MREGVKQRWVAALRSGEYKQAHGALRTVNPDDDTALNHCCLGVLCDLYAAETGIDWKRSILSEVPVVYLGAVDSLPEEVREWAGLSGADPRARGFTLAELNDGTEDDGVPAHSFDQIADIIEEEL